MHRLLIILIIGWLATSCATTSVQSHNQKPNSIVTVTGVGIDLESAKSDAMRAALALKTNQKIISEQLLVNDKLEKDLLASSLSGELSYFEIIDQTIDENGFFKILAKVGISKKKLRKANSVHNASSGNRFNGTLIANQISSAKALKDAEELHEKNQLQNAKKLTSYLLDGDIAATKASLIEINVNSERPDEVKLIFAYQLQEDWIEVLEQRLKIIKSLWNNKDFFRLTPTRDDDYYTKVCRDSMIGKCRYLPIRPNSEISNIKLLIPVFSSSGEYMTCLESNHLQKVLWEHNKNYHSYYGYGITTYWYSPKTRYHNLWVDSDKLYTNVSSAEFFYPYIVSEDSKPSLSCEIQGRKMHAAAFRPISSDQRRGVQKKKQDYDTVPGSKIKK